jgi:hypothetical protein
MGQKAAGAIQGEVGTPGQSGYISTGINQNDINQFLNPAIGGMLKYGTEATTNFANATGGMGGNTLKAINDYIGTTYLNQAWNPAVQNAMQNKQNAISNLYNVANLGVTASGAGATGAPAMGGAIGGSIAATGAAQAAGQVGMANAISGGIQNAGSWYSLPQILNRMNAPTTPTASAGGAVNPWNSGSFENIPIG